MRLRSSQKIKKSVNAISHCGIIAIYKLSYCSVACRKRKNQEHGNRRVEEKTKSREKWSEMKRKREWEREREGNCSAVTVSRLQQIRILASSFHKSWYIIRYRRKTSFLSFILVSHLAFYKILPVHSRYSRRVEDRPSEFDLTFIVIFFNHLSGF